MNAHLDTGNEFLDGFKPVEPTMIEQTRRVVKQLMINKDRRGTTETLAEFIFKNNNIFTIRDDDNPEMWIYKDGIYVPEGKSYIEEYCREILEEHYTTYTCNEVISKIRSDTFIDKEDFFSQNNPDEIAVKNGILNLRTKELYDFDPNKVFFSKINAEFDVDCDCPMVKKHFEAVLKSVDDIPVIQELFGFLLYKEYFIEKAFMMTGKGRNGKGKTLDLIKRFIGAENCANIPLQALDESNFAMSNLINKLANLGGDIDKSALKNTGKFKGLTGRDLMTADRKFKSHLSFTNFAKMIFCANELPITYDLSDAFWNRWVLLEFPFQFLSKKEISSLPVDFDKSFVKLADPNIVDSLTTGSELSGLLNWALVGLHRLFEQRDFSYSKSVNDVKFIWLRKSNSFLAFFMDELVEDFDYKVTKQELKKVYSLYCRTHKVNTVSDRAIKATLSDKGVSDSRLSKEGVQLNCWAGIKFKKQVLGNLENWSDYNGPLVSSKAKLKALAEFEGLKQKLEVSKEDV